MKYACTFINLHLINILLKLTFDHSMRAKAAAQTFQSGVLLKGFEQLIYRDSPLKHINLENVLFTLRNQRLVQANPRPKRIAAV